KYFNAITVLESGFFPLGPEESNPVMFDQECLGRKFQFSGQVGDGLAGGDMRPAIEGDRGHAALRMLASQSFQTGSSPRDRRQEATAAGDRSSEMANWPSADSPLAAIWRPPTV